MKHRRLENAMDAARVAGIDLELVEGGVGGNVRWGVETTRLPLLAVFVAKSGIPQQLLHGHAAQLLDELSKAL